MSEFADGAKQGLSFVVKNNAPAGKRLTILNTPVGNGNTIDLMQIPGISEDDVKAAILKGDLGRKLRSNYIQVISSTLTFENLDPTYTALLGTYGLSTSAAVNTIANAAALTAFSTAGLSDGDTVYVQSYRTNFKLRFSALTLRPHAVLASDNVSRVWIRDLGPSEWTYQHNWFYNKDTGNDENDGATASTPIKSLDEFCRRVRVFSCGTNSVPSPYTINLQTDTATADTWFPSGIVQTDGVQVGRNTGETLFATVLRGYRRVIAVPGGSGALTAAGTSATPSTNLKATFIDTNGVFTTLKGQMIMVADTATAASSSGAAASLAASSEIVTLTGGTGFAATSVNQLITITGSANSANNGTFPITEFVSATSVKYHNPNSTASDVNNGAISWVAKAAKVAWIINAPAFTTGTGITVTAVNVGIATLANAPASTFTSNSVGKRIRLSGGISANNGDFTITEFVSSTSVKIANVNAVVDATVQTFQGVVEVGTAWWDQSSMSSSQLNAMSITTSAAAPSTGSPYCVVKFTNVSQRSWGLGRPSGLLLQFQDCELSSNCNVASGQEVRLINCRMTNGGFTPGLIGPQSLTYGFMSCWTNPGAAGTFGALILQENGYWRLQEVVLVDYNVRIREAGPQALFQNSMIQGGYLGPAGEEVAVRPGAGLGYGFGQPRGLAVFNNVENSATNPSGVAAESAGAAVVMQRGTRAIGWPLWGIGALIGLHVKEDSRYQTVSTVVNTITDVAGSAGYPVSEVKIDQQQAIPTPNVTTGVPTAVSVTSGTNPTFTATNGIVIMVASGTTFTAASVGRTVTIAGANTSANNGIYSILGFTNSTTVTIRNPAGVTDAVGAGTVTENSVVTRWSQLNAAPYSGNAISYTTGTKITRVVGT